MQVEHHFTISNLHFLILLSYWCILLKSDSQRFWNKTFKQTSHHCVPSHAHPSYSHFTEFNMLKYERIWVPALLRWWKILTATPSSCKNFQSAWNLLSIINTTAWTIFAGELSCEQPTHKLRGQARTRKVAPKRRGGNGV